MDRYDHQKIEKKWQDRWAKEKSFCAHDASKKEKRYVLDMFPYPSAEGLHVGHPEGYTASDIYSRYLRMRGYEVLHPMGFDAFGLPAENYALKTGTHPTITTKKNIENMRRQIRSLGFSYDWDREVITTDPKYYQWTQWIFVQLFKHGLAYEADAPINWCPKDKTGLANEEVIDGKCERCGTQVTKKKIKQWLVKITDERYIERLLNDLEKVNWPENIKLLQRNWIGRSEGAEVTFEADLDVTKVILIHGKDTDPAKKWYPWFGEQVKQRGKKFIAPVLPEADDPELEAWLKEIDGTRPDEKSVLVGHSRGGVAILRWLERLPKGKKIKRVILIGTNAGTAKKPSKGFFDKDYNFEKIKSHCNDFVVFHSRDDNWVPFEAGEQNAKGLDARTFFPNDRAHFGKLTPTIPELIDEVFPSIKVFTTRPDTLFGATYLVLAPEHPLVEPITAKEQKKEVEAYVKKAQNKSDLDRTDLAKEKTGVFTGAYAINPVNNQKIPIWVADYVSMSYGTGAIMAVPAHDERDFEFAKKFALPVTQVVAPFFENSDNSKTRADAKTVKRRLVYGIVRNQRTQSVLCLQWKVYNWVSFVVGGVQDGETLVEAARREVIEETGYKNLKFIEEIDWVTHFTFYASHKSENRYGMASGVVFDLVDEKQDQIASEEQVKHEALWVPIEKVYDTVTHLNAKAVWRYYLKPAAYLGDGVMVNGPLPLPTSPVLRSPLEAFASPGASGHLDNELTRSGYSGPYDGVSSEKFRTLITQWLAKKGYGRQKVQYKLRDWLFSRQRYWGEPIPVVHCEHCKQRDKKTILIIHGTGSTGSSNWYSWLARELRTLGHEVIAPDLPHTHAPVLKEWLGALEQYRDKLDGNSIIVAHSLGGPAAMHLITRLGKKIDKLILVAPTSPNIDWKQFAKNNPDNPVEHQQRFNEPAIEYTKANSLAHKIVYFYSDNDFYLDKSVVEYNRKKLTGDFRLLQGRDHFSIKHGSAYSFPEVLEEIVSGHQWPVGLVPVPEKDLPLKLPDVKKYEPTGTGESPLANISKWVNTKCPTCGKPAKRETNTMPQWAGSNWYFLRYCDPKNTHKLADPKKLEQWLPVDLYVGGAEHAVLHLLYARFIYKFLFDIKAVPPKCGDEPFIKLKNQGLILGEDGQKMSKSRGNVINPDEVIQKFGADTMRMYEMFMGPFEDVKPWSTQGMIGVRRFLDRTWNMFINKPAQASAPAVGRVHRATHRLVKKVTEDIEQFKFNTSISAFMEYMNSVGEKTDEFSKADLEVFAKLLSPFAPHLAEELWERLGHKGSISKEPWPQYDPKLIIEDEIIVVVQINGKIRDQMKVSADINEEEVKKLALQSEKVQKWLNGKEPKKIIYIKGRLVSIHV